MARYYVVLPGGRRVARYIVAEVVREADDDGRSRDLSMASSLAGPEASILTEPELHETAAGRTALHRWRSGNDKAFDRETAGFEREAKTRRLRVTPVKQLQVEDGRVATTTVRREDRRQSAAQGEELVVAILHLHGMLAELRDNWIRRSQIPGQLPLQPDVRPAARKRRLYIVS